LLLRQATSSVGASIAIAVIVAVAAGLFTAWPRVARATGVAELNYRITQTPEAVRDLSGRQTGGWPVDPFGGDFEAVQATLDQVTAAAGPTLQPLIGAGRVLVSLQGATNPLAFSTSSPAPADLSGRELQFRASPGLQDQVQVVAGAAPAAWSGPPAPSDGGAEVLDPVPVMFSTATADRLGLAPGDLLTLAGVPIFSEDGNRPLQAVVTGSFDPLVASDPSWSHHVSGLVPYNRGDPDRGDIMVGAAYVHPDTAALLLYAGLTPTTDVWFPVEAGTQDAAGLLDDLREITARQIELGGQPELGGQSVAIELDSALIDVLSATIAAQRGTSAVLTMIAAGPVGVTFALLALATRLAVSRRRQSLALASARGGSPALLRATLGLEGALLGLPAAALGAIAATVVVPGPMETGDYLLVLLVALAPAALLALEPLPSLRTQRQDLSSRSPHPWRWVVETLVVAAAAAALYLLVSRGLQATSRTSVDPLATAGPLLVSLAAAVLATRLFPLPVRVVHAAMRRRRDLTGFLGSARAIREGGVTLVPMLALLVATSIATFSTTLLTTVSHGLRESTIAETGADIRMSGPPYFDDDIAGIAEVAGIAGLARVHAAPTAQLAIDGVSQRVTVYAVDSVALTRVQEGITGAVALPAGMSELVDGTVPVVVSPALMSEEGSDLSLYLTGVLEVSAVAVEPSAVGIANEARWVVADLDLLREVTGQSLVPRLLLVGLEPGADPEAATAALAAASGGSGTITAASARAGQFLDSPSARAMQQGAIAALVLSIVQSVLALVLTLVLAAPARRRLVGMLRTLGLGSAGARRLVAWELVPLASAALVAGTGLGLALPHLVVATVDLSAFTGQVSPPVVYNWRSLALVLVGVVAVVGITLLVASAVARRLSLSVLRIGDST